MENDSVVLIAQVVGGVAGLLAFAAWIWIVVLAFGEDIMSGILCLICGIYGLYYAVTRWDRCKVPFLASCAFSLLGFAGNSVVAANMVDTEGVRIWDTFVSRFHDEPSVALSEDLIQADMQRMQGRWLVMVKGRQETFEIEGDECRITRSGHQELFKFKLVPIEGYRAIDLVSVLSNQPTMGIYVLSSDQLKVVLGKPGGERPTQFKSGDNDQELFVLRRPWS